MPFVTVAVNGRTRPERHAAKALAIARSGRVICYVGPWRHITAIARRLPDELVALHRNPDGSGALIVGPAQMAPLADRI